MRWLVRPRPWIAYLLAAAISVAAAACAWLLFGRRQLADVVMLLLLGIVLVALRFGFGPSILAAVASVLLYDFFFVPPYLSFAVADLHHVVTFGVMFVVAVVVSNLATRVRAQADAAVASALERERLAEVAQRAQLDVEAERMVNTLLSSVSHDLRTPLSVITGLASALLEPEAPLAPEARKDLAATIHEEAQRLNRLVRNLLDMTRVASGAIKAAKEWQPIDGVIGAAIDRVEEALRGRTVTVHLPPGLPLVPIDGVLVEQVLINLLENAAKYTPAGTPVSIAARVDDGALLVEVSDTGPGIPPAQADRIFEKFYRVPREGGGGGVGLGLAICRGIVKAHGGRMGADNRPEGGAVLRFTLPIEGRPPEIVPEDGRGCERS